MQPKQNQNELIGSKRQVEVKRHSFMCALNKLVESAVHAELALHSLFLLYLKKMPIKISTHVLMIRERKICCYSIFTLRLMTISGAYASHVPFTTIPGAYPTYG
jgi:hypothetical protein